MEKIGFIGMGNMASAIVQGIVGKGAIASHRVLAYDHHPEKLQAMVDGCGILICRSEEELIEAADAIVIAIKPNYIGALLERQKERLKGKVVISLAAGWTYEKFAALLDASTRILCIMPNTPALVGEGVLLFEQTHSLEQAEYAYIKGLMSATGLVEELPSHLMGIGGVISSCSPAWIAMMIEALADAGVMYGVPRATAYRLVSQAVKGTAALQIETGNHPGVLKDQVCSPAGTTIVGVKSLEENRMRGAFLDAVDAVMKRKKEA